jgi:DNA-binding MarR family transcriptional regulator
MGTRLAKRRAVTRPLRLPGAIDGSWSEIPDACVCSALRMLSRYASRRLERMLAGHGVTVTELQLMIVLLQGGPASGLELARRLRLDPAPVGRSLARLRERGVLRRSSGRRLATWHLTPDGVMHLEVLELMWREVDASLRWELGRHVVEPVVRVVDALPNPIPREGQGWSD